MIEKQSIISVKEVARELGRQDDGLSKWVKHHKGFFHEPSQGEMIFVGKIFAVPHFQSLIKKQERLKGNPVADPFVIAKAKMLNGCVVTTEKLKPNAAKIPNVCRHFKIKCISLEKFMAEEQWSF